MTGVPRLLVLTDRRQCEQVGRDLPAMVARAVDAGAPAVVYREKDLAPAARRQLGVEVAAAVRGGGARLIVASDPELAVDLGADGIHLAADAAVPLDSVPAGGGSFLLGRSCHVFAEVVAAESEPLDYLTVSPVHATTSKPGYGPPLGVEGVAALVAAARRPVLALGGIGPAQVADLLAVGAHGVAVMGAVMLASDPATVTEDLLRELGGTP